MTKIEVEWMNQDDFPEELGQNGFSIDVLVYAEGIDEHQVGWFQYSTRKWHFLCNEQHIDKFQWRYFNELIDKPI